MKLKTPSKSTEFFQELEAFLLNHGWVLKLGEPQIRFETHVYHEMFSPHLHAVPNLIEEHLTIEAVGYVRPGEEE